MGAPVLNRGSCAGVAIVDGSKKRVAASRRAIYRGKPTEIPPSERRASEPTVTASSPSRVTKAVSLSKGIGWPSATSRLLTLPRSRPTGRSKRVTSLDQSRVGVKRKARRRRKRPPLRLPKPSTPPCKARLRLLSPQQEGRSAGPPFEKSRA